MATAKKKVSAASGKTQLHQQQSSRFWLMYPPKLITKPLLWQLAKKFEVVTNVRQASITDEIGLVCLELDGKRSEIKVAIKWLEKQGVKVEPVEINVIES
jgi:L-aspartate semialdehyde sulfurtransferase ferredoxin